MITDRLRVASQLKLPLKSAPLTLNEYRMYAALIANAGEVVECDRLMYAIYGDERWPKTNCLQVFASRIRIKLAGAVRLNSIYRVGYRLTTLHAFDTSRC